MDNFTSILTLEYWGNTVQNYLCAFGLFIILYLIFKAFETIIVVRLRSLAERTDNDFDDVLVQVIGEISPLFYLVLALYFPLHRLELPEIADKVIYGIFIIVILFQVIKFIQTLIEYFLDKSVGAKRAKGKEATAAFHGMKLVIKIVLWVLGFLLILSNLGFEVNSLVASLGIGGIAVALAIQNILGDIFSSFSLYFDKPFSPGDYVEFGDGMGGTVKKIGLKTTRLATLRGEELVVSNNELTSARIQNFKKIKNRRMDMQLGLVYGTPLAKMKKANEIIEKVIKNMKLAEFGRVHFTEFGDFSLNIKVMYYVLSPDYEDALKIQQEVNYGIMEEFKKAKIEFAYPTQTVIVEK